jgi:hypothetical protein
MDPDAPPSPNPESLDLVAVGNAPAIADGSRELADLRREAELAELAAETATARAAEVGVDGREATWALVQMQRFLDGLRADVERDVQAIRDLASDRARIRVERAQAEAARIRGDAPPVAFAAPTVVHRVPPPVPVVPATPPAVSTFDRTVVLPEVPSAADPVVVDPLDDDRAVPATPVFWSEPPARRARRRRRRLRVPLSAVLEVLAVLLLLVFILLRLS